MDKASKLILVSLLLFLYASTINASISSAAFFYGRAPTNDILHSYDAVVVSPDVELDVKNAKVPSTLYVYVSVGELDKDAPYRKQVPKKWLIGQNKAWQSQVIDQTNPDWQKFFLNNILAPLYDKGFHGFFFDTLDSYQLGTSTKEEKQKQVVALVNLIKATKQKFPNAKIILNRGFELLPDVHNLVDAVAVESLFSGWNQKQKRYEPVPEKDREYLLVELNKVKQYQLPIIIIDYVSPKQPNDAKITTKKIKDLGMIPWVTDKYLQTEGSISLHNALPRKLLVVYTPNVPASTQFDPAPFIILGTPMQYLGYVPEYVTVSELGGMLSKNKYAGIIVWVNGLNPADQDRLQKWLLMHLNKIPILFFGEFGFAINQTTLAPFGLTTNPIVANTREAQISYQDTRYLGFETKVNPNPYDFFPLAANKGHVLLKITSNKGQSEDAVAITPWGGYALDPYISYNLPNDVNVWIANPFTLLKTALRLPDMPVPDVTTENGRRLMTVHIDGDGFLTRADWPNGRIAAIELKERILERYPVPTSVSVITSEFTPDGLYPAISKQSIKLAQDIFALPFVEPASHTFSHPFDWILVQTEKTSGKYNLPVPNYHYDVNKELKGSIDFINQNMVPPNKKAKLIFWSGYANPDAKTVALSYQSGLHNINGGNTDITNALPFLSLISPVGLPYKDAYQVYAAIDNEEYYTNGWSGPYYGYQNVIQTFILTGKPIRYRPIDLYYHFYSANKVASLNALDTVYKWTLSQDVMNIYISEYIDKVLDSNQAIIAHEDDGGWVIKTKGNLREFRVNPEMGYPDLIKSKNVIGFNEDQGSLYVHLGPLRTSIIYFTKTKPTLPYLKVANGRIIKFERDDRNINLILQSYMPLSLVLANMTNCSVQENKQVVAGKTLQDSDVAYSFSKKDSNELTITCH